jgi:quercetin dioxygenase-like cupin family protein
MTLSKWRRRSVSRKAQYLKPVTAMIVPGIIVLCSIVLILAGGSVAPAAPAPRPQAKEFSAQMPDGAGKKLIVEKCQLCHSLERVVTSQRAKDDWQAVIDLMVEEGAPLTDDETKTVVNYLAANYGLKGIGQPSPAPPTATPTPSAPSMIVDPDQTQFVTPPDSLGLPASVQLSMITGDFSKPGLFSALVKLPDGQKLDPHWLSTDLNLVVLRGTYEWGNGDTYDTGKLQPVIAGEVVRVPAQAHHFGLAKGATVFLVYGVGPVSMSWAAK